MQHVILQQILKVNIQFRDIYLEDIKLSILGEMEHLKL